MFLLQYAILICISIAFIVAVISAFVLFKSIGMERGVFKHLILRDRTSTELGYVSSVRRSDSVGLVGITVTQLRPASTAEVNQERIDVVSNGKLIELGKAVEVIQVEGMRVVVWEIVIYVYEEACI